jgi:hypothetical protein
MLMIQKALFTLGTAVLLAGCVASIPPVEVTRFHLGQEIKPGRLAFDGDSALEAIPYREAVAVALEGRGFSRTVATIRPDYIAIITPSRVSRAEARRSPFSIGIGGGTGGPVGVGVGTSIALGGKSQTVVVSRLKVQLKRVADQQIIWEGRAETQALATAPGAQPGLAAKKLAMALFADFPGESGKTIVVP